MNNSIVMKRRKIQFVLTAAIITAGFLLYCSTAKCQCPRFLPGRQVGTVKCDELIEISGIAASRKNSGVIWAHNDKGGQAKIWAFNKDGTCLGDYNLVGANNNDWEDMAIGPGPDANRDYIYISDTGNNDGLINRTFNIYRVAEPAVSAAEPLVSIDLNEVDTLAVKYPDGLRHDCETIMIDVNSDIYICTRDRWNDDHGIMKIYRYPAPHSCEVVYTLQQAGSVKLLESSAGKRPNWEMAVGGDISRDGSYVIIRTKPRRRNKTISQRVLLWHRKAGTELWKAFDNPLCEIPGVSEPQGEAVCFDAGDLGYYTISEGRNQPIYYFARDKQSNISAVVSGDVER